MKKIDFQSVEKPQVTIDCVGSSVTSPIIASAKKNPNFENPWAKFDLVCNLYNLNIHSLCSNFNLSCLIQ